VVVVQKGTRWSACLEDYLSKNAQVLSSMQPPILVPRISASTLSEEAVSEIDCAETRWIRTMCSGDSAVALAVPQPSPMQPAGGPPSQRLRSRAEDRRCSEQADCADAHQPNEPKNTV